MTLVWGHIKINNMPLRGRKPRWGRGSFKGLCITSSCTNCCDFFPLCPHGTLTRTLGKGIYISDYLSSSPQYFLFCEKNRCCPFLLSLLRIHWYGKSFVTPLVGELNELSQQSVRWVLRQLHFWSTQEPSTRTIINQAHLLSVIQNEKCRNELGGLVEV